MHHRPRRSRLASEDPEQGQQAQNEARHETLSRKMEEADNPYDLAHRKLRFNRPRSEWHQANDRQRNLWSEEFARAFRRRLIAYHNTLGAVERRAE